VVELELAEIIDKALFHAQSQGADQAEAFTTRSRTLSLYVEDSKVKNLEEKLDVGLAIRVIHGRRIGEASSTVSSLDDIVGCSSSAIKAARVSEPDAHFHGFSVGGKSTISEPPVWDEEVAFLDTEALSSKGVEIVEACIAHEGIKVPRGMIRSASIENEVANSNGMSSLHRSTMVYLHFTSMTSRGKAGEGEETYHSTRMDMDTRAIGRSLAQGAKDSAVAVAFKGRSDAPVFIRPALLAEMFKTSVGFAVDSENVNRMRSSLAGKIGQEVTSPLLSITDDPGDPRGVLSAAHDDEGVPTRRKPLIEKGVLRSFLYDGYNASMAGEQSTGNGFRRSAQESQSIYQMPVRVSPVNMVVEAGSKGYEDLIGSFDRAIVIERMAWPEVNPITGAFGLEVRCAHVMERGERVQTVKHAILTGNMFESLRKVFGIANDQKVQGSWIVPTMGFDGMELVGNP
jgi:PmbA protein